jgi:hypothetical protein
MTYAITCRSSTCPYFAYPRLPDYAHPGLQTRRASTGTAGLAGYVGLAPFRPSTFHPCRPCHRGRLGEEGPSFLLADQQ